MSQLRHPNIVLFMGITLDPERCYIVEAYYKHGALTDLLFGERAPRNLPWNMRVNLMCSVAKGLQYLHRHCIVHRDVKTDNILLEDSWNPVICDFGLSSSIKQRVVWHHVEEEARRSMQEPTTEKGVPSLSHDSPRMRVFQALHGLLGTPTLYSANSEGTPPSPFHSASIPPEMRSAGTTQRRPTDPPPKLDRDSDVMEAEIMTTDRGTTRYMSPEVLSAIYAKQAYMARSYKVDCFSFGIMMYLVVVRHYNPYPAIKWNEEVERHVLAGGRPEITGREVAPAGWQELMERCWDSDPDLRPDMGEVALVLKDIGHGEHMAKRKSVQSLHQVMQKLESSLSAAKDWAETDEADASGVLELTVQLRAQRDALDSASRSAGVGEQVVLKPREHLHPTANGAGETSQNGDLVSFEKSPSYLPAEAVQIEMVEGAPVVCV